MDRWLDQDGHPATRAELHYGARIIRCFVERPKSVHADAGERGRAPPAWDLRSSAARRGLATPSSTPS